MSDILKRAKKALEEREKQGGADGTGPTAAIGTQERSIQLLEELRNKMSSKNDGLEDWKPGGLSMLSNTDRENRTIASANMMRDIDSGAYDNATIKSIPDPNAKDAEYAKMNFMDKVGMSISSGVGDVIKGTGDALQFLTSLGFQAGDGWGDNPLQLIGEYMTDEFKMETDTDFSQEHGFMDLIKNPEFWATEAPKVIPQIADALMLGGIAKKGVTTAGKFGAKKFLKESTKQGAKGGKTFVSKSGKNLKATLGGVEHSTKGAGNSSFLRRFYTDQGKLTRAFSETATTIGAGALMNMKVGMQNGTEMFNTYSSLEGENSEPMFTRDQAADMASKSFLNNLLYVPVDIASYALTFGSGKGLNVLSRSAANPTKLASEFFKNGTVDVAKRFATFGGKALAEGFEEAYQESWEEWAKMKAFYDVTGGFDGYKGKVPEALKKGDLSLLNDFMTFYNSDENKTTRNLAGILGGVMGGGMNVRSLINKSASDAYDFKSRVDFLENKFKNTPQDAVHRNIHAANIISDAIYEGKEDRLVDILNSLHESETITDAEYERHKRTFDEIAHMSNEIRGIGTLRAQKAYLRNHAFGIESRNRAEGIRQNFEDNVRFIKENVESESEQRKQIEQARINMEEGLKYESQILAAHENAKQALLAGKSFAEVKYKSNVGTNKDGVALDEENLSPSQLSNIRNKAKSIFNNLAGKAGKAAGTVSAYANEAGLNAKGAKNFVQNKLNQYTSKSLDSASNLDEAQSVNINGVQHNMDSIEYDPENNTITTQDGETYTQEGGKWLDSNGVEANIKYKPIPQQKSSFKSVPVQDEEGNTTFNVVNEKGEVVSQGHETNEDALNEIEGIEKRAEEEAKAEEEKAKAEANSQPKPQENPLTGEEAREKLHEISEKLDDPNYDPSDDDLEFMNNNQEELDKIYNANAVLDDLLDDNIVPTSNLNYALDNKEVLDEVAQRRGVKNVDELIKNQVEKQIENEENLDDNEIAYLKEASERVNTRKKDDHDTEQRKKNANVKRDASEFNDDSENIFNTNSNSSPSPEVRLRKKKKSKDDSDSDPVTPENKNKKAGFLKKALSYSSRKVGRGVSNMLSVKDSFTDHYMDNASLAEMYVANETLAKMYPNMNVTAAVVPNMQKVLGHRALGLTLNNVIYIDETSWNKENVTYFHELNHINFMLSKNEPETKKLIEKMMEDKEFVNEIKKRYERFIQYESHYGPDGKKLDTPLIVTKEQIYQSLKHANPNKKITKEDLETYIENQGERLTLRDDLDQEVIVDEVFAETMAFSYDAVYKNKFFEEREIVKTFEEREAEKSWLRKYIERKTGIRQARRLKNSISNWIKSIKDKAKSFNDPVTKKLLEKRINEMTTDEYNEFRSLKQKQMEAFMAVKPQNFTNPSLRFRILDENFQQEEDEKNSIRERIFASNDVHVLRNKSQEAQYRLSKANQQIVDMYENDLLDTTYENGVHDEIFNSDRMKPIRGASAVVKKFSSVYNKALRYNYIKNKTGNSKWKIPTFDGDELMVDLYDLASEAKSGVEFIHAIENSNREVTSEFNKYLDFNLDDKASFLNSFWMVAKDVEIVDTVKSYVNSRGNFEVQSALSLKETSAYDNAFWNATENYKAYNAFIRGNSNNLKMSESEYYNRLGKFRDFNQSVKNIQEGNFTNEDLYKVANFFGADSKLFNRNLIYIDGRKRPLDSAVVALAKRLGNNDSMFTGTGGSVKPEIIKFTRGLVVANRHNSADFTTTNAEGNQIPTRQVKSHLMRKLKEMSDDARIMTQRQFIEKYSKNSRRGGKGTYTNDFLKFAYNKAKKGVDISLSQNAGIQNDYINNSSDFTGANSNENSLNEFMTFVSSFNKGSYIMETGRLSDSPVSYMMEVKAHKMSDFGNFDSNGKFKFNSKQSLNFTNVFNSHNAFMGGKENINDFKNMLEEAISEEIDFLNENHEALTNVINTKDLIDPKTKRLNKKGYNAVASYVLNNTINGIQFAEVFMPDISAKDYLKRSKLMRSPGHAMSNVQFESLFFKDSKIGDTEIDDSAMFILESDADRIRAAFGGVMDLNKGFKFLHAGMEQNHPIFKGNNFYGKGYTVILNDEYVRDNPSYAPLYEVMKSRKEKILEANNGQEPLITDDSDLINHIVLAMPMSSNKIKDANGNTNLPAEFESMPGLSMDDMDIDAMNKFHDNLYYKDGMYTGLDGNNLVLQQKMDMYRDNINTPIQMIKAIPTNGGVDGKLDKLDSIVKKITDLEQKQLESIIDLIENGTVEDLNKNIKKYFDQESIDSLQKFLLFDDDLSINTPAARTIAINTLLNQIRIRGNKLNTPGTIAQQKPDRYSKNVEVDGEVVRIKTGGESGLSFYTDNNLTGGHNPGEAVIPKFMKGKIRPRQYRIFSKSKNSSIISYNAGYVYDPVKGFHVKGKNTIPKQAVAYANGVLKEAKASNAVNQNMTVEEFMARYEVRDAETDNVIGFYIPGENIIATRIPSHGPQSTGVFEAIGFDSTGASQIQLPYEFAQNITGGDFDGDQVFIQHRGDGTNEWNDIFKEITDHWLSKEMKSEVLLPLDFKAETQEAVNEINKQLNKRTSKSLMFTPSHRRKSYDDTIVSKNNVGAAANYHSYIGMLSAYESNFSSPIIIDGELKEGFKDRKGESRTIESAKLFNVILDNASHQFADALGINENTVGDAIILRNLGYNLKQIGLILNSETYNKFNKINNAKGTLFANSNYDEKLEGGAEINIDTKLIGRDPKLKEVAKNEKAIESLIVLLSKIKSDLSDISSVMGGHSKIENDPFILTDQIENLERLLSNGKNDQALKIPEGFANNPLVQNYLNVAKTSLKMQEKINPTSRPDGKEIYGSIIGSTIRNVSQDAKRKLNDDMEKFFTSRLLGYNNISEDYKKSLTENGNPNNIFDRLNAVIQAKKDNVVYGNTPQDVINEFDQSLLLTKGLSYNLGTSQRGGKYISIRSSFFNENMTNEERQILRDEFAKLDPELRRDLLLYDLSKNSWKGPLSLFHLMDKDFMKEVSRLSDLDMKNRNKKMNDEVKDQAVVALAEMNQNIFPKLNFPPHVRDSNNRMHLNPLFLKQAKGSDGSVIFDKILRGEPVSFISNVGNRKALVQFKGLGSKLSNSMNNNKSFKNKKSALNKISENLKDLNKEGLYKVNIIQEDVGPERLISIKDDSTTNPINPIKTKKSSDEAQQHNNWLNNAVNYQTSTEPKIRLRDDKYWNFEDRLDKKDLDLAMEYDSFISENQKELNYKKYEEERSEAEKISKEVNDQSVKEMSTDELISKFNEFSNKNQYAYAVVLNPVMRELGGRIALDQTKNYTGKEFDGKDISFMQKYLMANNIPSNHPMVQGAVRTLMNEEKQFNSEKKKYNDKLMEVTNNLYKEQLGYIAHGGKLKDKLKALFDYLFTNKESLYSKLYGPIITYDLVQKNDKNGEPYTMRVMKYKPKEQIEKEYADGKISKAQYDFYNATSEIANDLGKYGEYGKHGLRSDFIPHVSPGQMEAFSRRGLMGLLMTSKNLDERIKDVKMNYTDPVSGKTLENVSFSDIDFMYSLATSENKGTARPLEYYKLKRKAYKLLQKGVNEDGSPIKLSDVDMGTAMGGGFMNRFTNSASMKSNHFVSLDLNKAFGEYIHTSLWTNGNDKFKGMKNMLPIVDSTLAFLDKKGMRNMYDHVSSVWKENFLKGTKKNSFKTPAELKALGITTDKVVDYITKGSLVYWLGFKGFAIGGGMYAIGNILNGKFNNIANHGRGQWLKGEKRFWLGRSGKFNILDPFKGVREANTILKNLGFMDINLYDDVTANKGSSLENMFMNMALMPMSYSERWIQGVHFLGMLTDQEWNDVLENKPNALSNERLNLLEDQVKLSHGKGYQKNDQRMIQMYSWGRMMMQFSRHIPTVFYNNLAKKDLDIYGNEHIGNYRQFYNTIQEVVTGAVKPGEFKKYYDSLSDYEKRKLRSGLAGFGILTTAGALGVFGMDNKYTNDLSKDVNIFLDVNRLENKLTGPPAVGMLKQIM